MFDLTQILPKGFKTSISVLSTVMNLSESTIANHLKKYNIGISDWSRKNIGADQLELLSIFFNKKVKNFFTSSIDELESLSDSELHQLHSFCTIYSKTGSFTKSWRSIDKDKLKGHFLQKIVEDTPDDEFERFSDFIRVSRRRTIVIDVSNVNLQALRTQVLNLLSANSASIDDLYVDVPQTICDGFYTNPPIDFSFTRNHRYQARLRKQSSKFITIYTPTLRIVYVSARYHIFSDDGVNDEEERYMFLAV